MINAPLEGVKVVELEGQGPCPHAAMILRQFGAEIVRVERPASAPSNELGTDRVQPVAGHGEAVELDLKDSLDRDRFLGLVGHADVLLEGYRPGVAERLGIGPGECMLRNPRLIYARMTGWGQTGPLSNEAGHDINYLAVTGVLHAIGHAGDRPTPPLNLVGDFGGGSLFLVTGVLSALFERTRSGLGQVLDVAIVDGVEILARNVWERLDRGQWSDSRGSNLLDSGAPFYDTYACADGKYVAVGAIEPKFFRELLTGLELPLRYSQHQYDVKSWPHIRRLLTERFQTKSRDAWAESFKGKDACVSPVLSLEEAKGHEHLVARGTLTTAAEGRTRPGASPRFSRSRTLSIRDVEALPLPEWASTVLEGLQ